ncbi:VWA domain-containing protein [Clostridium isatidis]|uniref:VWFA domain-containing protein n=1 Tax=Clostridium isatidis TaxID=182773 RepID=A0A343J9U1_9CLOT|nr:VWA domain-containing protein [Clostridium isatidis]ASW42299.1 hypothetical protein BEN51_01980 [Clostridium isatidis]
MKKKKIKIISLLLSFFIIISFITFENINVRAQTSDKPDFDVVIESATPNPALLGEDITIKGKIIPKPFETTVPPKEIVLVLDVSGSMEGNRIKQLKEAVKNFINKMNENKIQNLKIGIVAYSSIADFNPIQNLGEKRVYSYGYGYHNVTSYKSYSSSFLNANDSKLYQIIDSLSPLGGTNIGEGIRKAIYMLQNGNASANKAIVLMTDGEPTFYSVTNSSLQKYMIINNNSPEIAGQGTGLDNKALDYARDIAKIINDSGYNAFSIGYEMSDRGNEALEKIHSSMIGEEWNSNTKLTEQEGFYKTSEGAIDLVFQKIASEIINSYPVNDLALNMEFNEGFSLNIGGNTVNIGTVNYKKDDSSQNGDKIIYKASPIPFEFTIKGSEEGSNFVFEDLNLSYSWEDKTQRKPIYENIEVIINSNELPNISAKLLSEKNILVKTNEEITLEYEINPSSFKFTDTNNASSNDVAIIIDTSMDMKEEISIIKNAVFNKLLSNNILKNTKTHYSLITYSNKSSIVTDLYNNKNKDYYKDYNQYITDLNDKYLKNITTDQENPNAKNIKVAFPNIINVLKEGRKDAGKTLIIIGNEKVSYSLKDIEEIKEKGYNIITLSVENNQSGNLYNLHKDLNGKEENYFYIQDPNNIENSIMNKVADILISGIRLNGYEFNPEIKLNLAGNFEAVNGIEKFENNIATIKVPKIIYNYNSKTGLYEVDKEKSNLKVSFTIKAKAGKSGELAFGNANDNKLVYEKLVYKNESDKYKYSLIYTPKITVRPQVKNLIHGLFNGIEGNSIKIDNSMAESGFSIAANSTITYGASFILEGNELDFSLKVDPRLQGIKASEIRAYILEGSNIVDEGVTIESIDEANLFKLNIKDAKPSSAERQVLLLYKRKMLDDGGDNNTFTNEIKIDDLKQAVTVKLYNPDNSKPKLPDLF